MSLVLHKLRETSSRIEKERILKTADTFEQKTFEYAYNPDLTFGVKFNNINWKTVRQAEQLMFVILDKLAERKLTGNEARDQVERYAEQFGDLIKLICNKDLDCGVTATTLNKVFGKGFVPEFKVQLAKEVPIKECPLPCIGQLKYNGVRVIAFITKQSVTFKTRNGKSFEYPALAEELFKGRNLQPYDFVLDGELTIGDSQGTNHTQVSGIVNSAIQGSPIRQTLTYNIFDCMPKAIFDSQGETLNYTLRFAEIEHFARSLNCPFVYTAETYEFYSYDDLEVKFKDLLTKGYEGLILKQWNDTYKFKRSKDWIKLKSIKTADIKCVGIEEGSGKYEGEIGALTCKGLVEGLQISVSVGTGLSDADRYSSWSCFIDKTIEVKYNEVIRNKTDDGWTLFLPRFVTIRCDK